MAAVAAVPDPAVAVQLLFGGGGGLDLSAGALPVPANVTADLYDAAGLPTALLPRINETFAPASLVVDLRPSGVVLRAPVTLRLVRAPLTLPCGKEVLRAFLDL